MFELTVNPDCSINSGASTTGWLLGDVNRLTSGNVTRYSWYSAGTGYNCHSIYDWLVSHNKARTGPGWTTQNFNTAYTDPTGTIATQLNAQLDFVVGNLSSGGVAFALNGNSTTSIYRAILIRNADGTTKTLQAATIPIQVGVGSGSNADYYFYLFDKEYNNGTLPSNPMTVDCTGSAYNLEDKQIPALQPVYTTAAYNNLDEMMIYSGTDLTYIGEGDISLRRTKGLVSGLSQRSYNDYTAGLKAGFEYVPDPNEGGGSSDPGGGGGSPQQSYDIDFPDLPPELLIESGLIKMFNPSVAQMNQFVNYIYSAADSIINNFKKIWSNPMDSIISLAMVPVNVNSSTSENMKFCGQDSGVSAPVVSHQFMTVDCGSPVADIKGDYNSFLDFSPHTELKLYLPFVGIVDVNADDVIDASLRLKYNIDLFTGESQAFLKCTKTETANKIDYDSVMYTWDANIVYSAPISGNNWQQLYNGVAKLVTSGAGAIAMGNPMPLISSGLDFATSQKVSTSRGGSLKANSGFLGDYVPYFIISTPITSVPGQAFKYRGYPSDMTDAIGNFHGYNELDVDTLQLTNFSTFATSEEIQEIKEILSKGVVLP